MEVQREVSTSESSNSRMADLSVSGSGLFGDTLVIDVTVAGIISVRNCKDRAEKQKNRRYKNEINELPHGSHFYPFAMTSVGGRSKKAKECLQRIAPILARRQSISLAEAFQFCYRRISVALACHALDNLLLASNVY